MYGKIYRINEEVEVSSSRGLIPHKKLGLTGFTG